MAHNDKPPLDRFVGLDELAQTVGVYSKHQLQRLAEQGVLPPRRQVGPRKTAWLESEIRTWMQNTKRVRIKA